MAGTSVGGGGRCLQAAQGSTGGARLCTGGAGRTGLLAAAPRVSGLGLVLPFLISDVHRKLLSFNVSFSHLLTMDVWGQKPF